VDLTGYDGGDVDEVVGAADEAVGVVEAGREGDVAGCSCGVAEGDAAATDEGVESAALEGRGLVCSGGSTGTEGKVNVKGGRGTYEAVDYTSIVGEDEGVRAHKGDVVGRLDGWVVVGLYVAELCAS
jgi:hypothetical protein